MTYDLFFYTRAGTAFDSQKLSAYFERHRHFTVSPSGDGELEVGYENRDTGVHFSFSYAANDEREIADESPSADYVDIGLSFNINYARPLFFATEAMPLVEALAQELQLLVVDPQHQTTEDETPQECRAAELIQSWDNSNTKLVRQIDGLRADKYYLPRERGMDWWRYAHARASLQEQVGEQILAPRVVLLKGPRKGRALTAYQWKHAVPQLLPVCDYVIVERDFKLFGLIKTVTGGLIRYDDLMSQVGEYLEPFDGPVPGLKVLRSEAPEALRQRFQRLALISIKGFVGISPDSVLDVEDSPGKE